MRAANSRPYRGLSAKLTGGPQGSAAGGGVKRPYPNGTLSPLRGSGARLGRRLVLHKRSAGQSLSANPDCCKFAIVPFCRKIAYRYNPRLLRRQPPKRGHEGAIIISNHPRQRIPPLSIVNCQLSIARQIPISLAIGAAYFRTAFRISGTMIAARMPPMRAVISWGVEKVADRATAFSAGTPRVGTISFTTTR